MSRPTVGIVDDDASMRESLAGLLRAFDYDVRAFVSSEAFLASSGDEHVDCLVLDVALPGMSGVELQLHLAGAARRLPIVFITASAPAALQHSLLERGAVACLVKPFPDEALLDAIRAAVAAGRAAAP